MAALGISRTTSAQSLTCFSFTAFFLNFLLLGDSSLGLALSTKFDFSVSSSQASSSELLDAPEFNRISGTFCGSDRSSFIPTMVLYTRDASPFLAFIISRSASTTSLKVFDNV
ncbi:Protein of unknown function [Gryllus bimaculatus]|nr:Protein of unknown function [Gryllus bimaculatus]